MPTDLTKADIERPRSLTQAPSRLDEARSLIRTFIGEPRLNGEPWARGVLAYVDQHLASEPDRILAAERRAAEAMREAATQVLDRDVAEYEWARDKATDDSSRDRLAARCRALRQAAESVIALPLPDAPAEPAWTPTHRHYKGGLYRELRRGIWAWNGNYNGKPVVAYENEAGEFFVLPVEDWEGTVWIRNGGCDDQSSVRRYEPIAPIPAEPGPESPQAEELAERISAKTRQISDTGLCRWELRGPDEVVAALEAENAKLREALACVVHDVDVLNPTTSPNLWGAVKAIGPNTARRARALLQGDRHVG